MNEEIKYEIKITGYTFLASFVFFPSSFWLLISKATDYIDPYIEWITYFYIYLFRPSAECFAAWVVLLFPPIVLQIVRTIIYYWKDPHKIKDVFRIYRPERKTKKKEA